ncbi:glycosyl hydrolase family 28-related protein [Bacillus sp. CECT 9360]|uniref:glycosyl hydrolase family 28-related protein n=1 Tax=Bacillus sp. CECT 9360 TaxID=2845821 RepID=UPI001E4BDDD7|nr:glycosyl hydrolase family 28-related protein [Bacillus sp. CECT 9360]CAH0345159.1 hypothetical protein BCI9360_01438 [Bacillus sp. CECT 9360]
MGKWKLALLSIVILLTLSTIFYNISLANGVETVNVQQFGARGDGVTDDTQAIQQAINSSAGKTVIFPEGTYMIKSLNLPSNISLQGQGAVLQARGETRTCMILKGSNIKISNLTIDGIDKVLTGIYISMGSENILIQNTTIQNFSTSNPKLHNHPIPSGVRIFGNTKNITIDRSTIKNIYSRVPVKSSGNHYVARGVFIMPYSVSKPEKAPENIVIQDSLFDGIGPKDDGDGINVQNFKQKVTLTIKNNKFENNHKRAIKIQDPGAVITGNTIINSFNGNNHYQTYAETNTHDMFSAISVYASDILIEDNTISGSGSYSAAIDIDSAHNVTIRNNKLENGFTSRYRTNPLIRVNSVGNRTKAISDLTITGNHLENGSNGIYFASPIRNVTLSDNTLVNCK